MSASEKLKALGGQLVDDDRYVTAVAEERVLESLPQIVAVVEAAERLPNMVQHIAGRSEKDRLDTALSALEEALS